MNIPPIFGELDLGPGIFVKRLRNVRSFKYKLRGIRVNAHVRASFKDVRVQIERVVQVPFIIHLVEF